MKHQIRIEEKYSALWPAAAIASFVLAGLFGMLYIRSGSILYEGYLRLAAFIFLAAGILSIFKLKDGKVTLIFDTADGESFSVHYLVKNSSIHQDEWNFRNIASVKVAEMPNRSLYNDIVTSDRCVAIRFENDAEWMYLNKLNGRIIPLTKENAEKIKLFIEEARIA